MAYAADRGVVRCGGGAIATGLVVLVMVAWAGLVSAEEAGFETMFDGKSLAGWQASEHRDSWKVVDGAIVCHGPRSHLFYVGPDAAKPAEFKNFHFKADVLTKANSNSGIFFHTKFQPEGWPDQGYEMQVNNSFARDPVRTGSIYHYVKNFNAPVQDDTWYTQELIVNGPSMTVIVNDKKLFEYVEPPGVTGAAPGQAKGSHKLSSGTFALQAHDPGSEVHFKNIRVKRLP
jgi:hypothetical protein